MRRCSMCVLFAYEFSVDQMSTFQISSTDKSGHWMRAWHWKGQIRCMIWPHTHTICCVNVMQTFICRYMNGEWYMYMRINSTKKSIAGVKENVMLVIRFALSFKLGRSSVSDLNWLDHNRWCVCVSVGNMSSNYFMTL